MIDLKLDINNVLNFVSREEIFSRQNEVISANEQIRNKSGKGNDFLGWVDLPDKINSEEVNEIKKCAGVLRKNSDLIVVVGIGGSYLGARAVIDALSHSFKSQLKKNKRYPLVLFAGQNIGENYTSDLFDILDKKDYSLIVISKSGTTTEPAIAFRLLKNHIEKKYGRKEARRRIVAVTDKEKGALRKLSLKEGYRTFVIPDDVGGRFSVLSPVGLLPVATAGLDIEALLKGAKKMSNILKNELSLEQNPAMLYATIRNLLYRKNKNIEILANFTPELNYLIEWWKQLFGESEGKDGKGIFPAGVSFTTDLHSMGQYIQSGTRNLFETFLWITNSKHNVTVSEDSQNLDGLNYIAGKRLNEINEKAMLGTAAAHVEGGVPNMLITIPDLNEYYIGQLIYFFEYACALSSYMLGVNPFDQPGVEAYKRNMFELLRQSLM